MPARLFSASRASIWPAVPFFRIIVPQRPLGLASMAQSPVSMAQVTLFLGVSTELGVKLATVSLHSLLWRYRPMTVYSVSC